MEHRKQEAARQTRLLRILRPLLIAAAVAAVDLLIKQWAIRVLRPVGSIPVIQDVLHLTYAQNTGASFSILEGNVLLLIEITSAAIVAIFIAIYDPRWCGGRYAALKQITLAVLAGGAIGNLIDRMLLGYVVDYIDFCLINWPVSNFADHCVVICGILFCVILLFFDEDSLVSALRKTRREQADTAADGEEGGHV